MDAGDAVVEVCWTPPPKSKLKAAADMTEAIATTVGVVEVLLDAGVIEGVDGVLVDAVIDVVKGTAGVGGASKRINIAKFRGRDWDPPICKLRQTWRTPAGKMGRGRPSVLSTQRVLPERES